METLKTVCNTISIGILAGVVTFAWLDERSDFAPKAKAASQPATAVDTDYFPDRFVNHGADESEIYIPQF